jgi:hypothetical protein
MKYLKFFDEYIIEVSIFSIGNDPNLAINYNIKRGRTFNDDNYSINVDGDGPSAANVVIPLDQKIKKVKLKRGSTTQKNHDDRKAKSDSKSEFHRIASTIDFQTDDDITNFSVDRKPNSDA